MKKEYKHVNDFPDCPCCNKPVVDVIRDTVVDIDWMNKAAENKWWSYKPSPYLVFHCAECNYTWKVEEI